MGDSIDTKDLDSYGVWVKMPPQDSANNEKQSLDELLDTGALDSIGAFPDFSEPDKSSETDSKEAASGQETQDEGTEDLSEAAFSDTTLTEEELLNISDSMNVTEEVAESGDEDNLIADDFFPDLDDTAQAAEKSEDIASEDVALDDFMDEDFAASEAPAQDSAVFTEASDDGEVSLDDFLDDVSFGSGQDDMKKEDDISDETPLDIDLKFNEAVSEQVPVEDEISPEDTTVPENPSDESQTASDDAHTAMHAEEVDLSDFGIDASAAETPVTTAAKDENDAENTVDYNLSVADTAQTAAAPAVQTVQDGASDAASNTSDNSLMSDKLLQQIVDDLSGLKNEITSLKAEFDELKSRDFLQMPPESTSTPELPEEDTGFFSGRDEDDTIALSGDELNNIMQSADFTSEDAQSESVWGDDEPHETVDDYFGDKIGIEDEALTATETHSDEYAEQAATTDEPEETVADYFGDKTGIEDELDPKSADTAQTETSLEEPHVIEEQDFEEESPFGAIREDEIIIPDEEHHSGLTLDMDNEVLEEPDLDNLKALHIPEEISVPKVEDGQDSGSSNLDDILVESSATDFMDSVKDTTEPAPESMDPPKEGEMLDEMLADDLSINEVLSKESVDYLAEEGFVDDGADANAVQKTDNINTTGADIPSDLKADVKSVLLYMDQLLENLPEEKIMEFAKSEQFITYKKLFTELGLA